MKDLSKKTNNQLWKLRCLLQKATELSYNRYLQTEKVRYLRVGEGFLLAQIRIDREFQNRGMRIKNPSNSINFLIQISK